MIDRNQRYLKKINIISDAILVFFSYIGAMWIRYSLLNGSVTVNPYEGKYLLTVAILSVAVSVVYQAVHSSYLSMIGVTAGGTLAIMAMFFISRVTEFSRWSLVIFFILTSVLVIAKHALGHRIVSSNASLGNGVRTVAVAGNGITAERYKKEAGKEYPLYTFKEYEEDPDVDEIVIALEPEEMHRVPEILSFADKEGIYISMVPFFSEYIPIHPEIETVGKTKLINLRATPLDNIGNAFLKRIIDIVGAFCMLLVLLPLMLVTALGVRVSSPGPIFFRQERVGKDKKPFYMLKFRSMRVNSEESTAWSQNTDPRRTKFGSFIRKYSIDELPQLINVLKGDMSLVGPRPEIPYYVRQFKESVPLYLVRQQVRPGMTGWAQIHGLRGDTSIESRVEYDIWYIENWSLSLDLEILLATVFKGKFKNEEQ